MKNEFAKSVRGRLTLLIILLACLAILMIAWSLLSAEPHPIHESFEHGDQIGEAWQIDAGSDCRFSLSSVEARDDTRSLRIDAPAKKRCELVPRIYSGLMDKLLREPFETSRRYRFSVFIADIGDAPPAKGLSENTVIAQWHASPDPFIREKPHRGPPLAIRIHNGTWGITYGWDRDFRSQDGYVANNWHWLGPVEEGRWTDWDVQMTWSFEDNGMTEIRRNRKLVFARAGPNTYNDLRGVYLKLGIYHPVSETTIYLDRVSVANATK